MGDGSRLNPQTDETIEKDGHVVCSAEAADKSVPCLQSKDENQHKNKLIETAFLCISYGMMGWIRGQQGPSLPDLQLITAVGLERGATYFTAYSIGVLIGVLFGGVLYDRYNHSIVLCVSIVGISVTVAVMPWCAVYGMMVVINLISGTFRGGMETGVNVICVTIWRSKARLYIQLLHFSLALGAILGPLAIDPFLSPKLDTDQTRTTNMTLYSDCKSNKTCENITISHTSVTETNSSVSVVNGNHTAVETNIHIAYLISALLMILTAFPIFVIYYKHKKDRRTSDKDVIVDNRKQRNITCVRVVMFVLVGFVFFTYCSAEAGFTTFLAVFCVDHMGWTKSEGSYATSLFWASFGGTRFFAIVFLKSVRSDKLIFIFLSANIASFVVTIFSGMTKTDVLFWVCIALCGFSMSIVFPTVFYWSEESLFPATGKTASGYIIFAASGAMLSPLILGYLMQEVTLMWFAFLLLIESVACLVMFTAIFFISKQFTLAQEAAQEEQNFDIQISNNIEKTEE